MVRGLIVRQIFVICDIALAVALVGTLALVAGSILSSPVKAAPNLPEFDLDSMSAALREVEGRGAYNAITDNRLFGEAGAYDPAAEPPPPPPPPVEDIEETPLNLRLVGTTAQTRFASAIIEDMDNRGSIHTFVPGDTVVDQVTLEEVDQRAVIIVNSRGGSPKKERLSMDDEDAQQAALQRAQMAQAQVPAQPTDNSPDRVTLNRQEFIHELYTNYADLVTKVKPEMYRDASGNIVGVTAKNIGQIPLASKLGLADGDVLQSVNNEAIDSEAKIMEMVQKYRNSSSFRIGIMRNGQTKVITYRLQ